MKLESPQSREQSKDIFGCRDENGKEISGIRSHDKDGNDLDGDITEMVTVEVDGEEKVLKKVCRKNYNKKVSSPAMSRITM